MTTRPAMQALKFSPIGISNSKGRRISGLGDEQLFARLGSVGIQAALAILLSVLGMGSAMAQSVDADLAYGANTQATRERVISELRQARADGTMKRWSPVLVEVPFKRPLKGSRFEPFSTHQGETESGRLARDGSEVRSTEITSAAPGATQ